MYYSGPYVGGIETCLKLKGYTYHNIIIYIRRRYKFPIPWRPPGDNRLINKSEHDPVQRNKKKNNRY